MNRGSALKWISLITSGEYDLNDGHYLKWVPIPKIDRPLPSYTPCGILEEFIQKGMHELDWSGIWYLNKEGTSPFMVSKDTLAKVKAKTDLSQVDDHFISSNHNIMMNSYDVQSTIDFIMDNYERL